MNILVTTLNSKYIHSSLSIRYLKSYCIDIFPDIKISEYTINQENNYIAAEIYKQNPDIIAFSCYIWNIDDTLDIAERLKIVKPDIKIILGGPEVSFDGIDILKKNSFIDFIIFGEGEETFRELLISLEKGQKDFHNIKGLVFRKGETVIQNEPRCLIDILDKIPSPFKGSLEQFKDKIIYYECSRGCPYNCEFCLSSAIKGVRFFSLERVKSDLDNIINAKVKQVKFVDRTFNANKKFALEIMKYITSKKVTDINFHFEITAHILDDEMLNFLKDVPEGLFQFEIGVQTTNPKTLEVINRKTNMEKLGEVVKKIKSYRNIHQHLDLIAGLPYEDYESFRKSFNDVYKLTPDYLQLGFLKLLKGSGLREKKEQHGYKFLNKAPYEILESKYVSYREMLRLKVIEDLVEKYNNEDGFEITLNFIVNKYYREPFDFFEQFGIYWDKRGLHNISHSKTHLYKILYNFYLDEIGKDIEVFNELIKFDFICNNKNGNIPSFIETQNTINIKTKRHQFLKNEDNLEKYIPKYRGMPAKKIINEIHFEEFKFNIIDFIKMDYDTENINKRSTIILFVYDKERKVFDKCRAFDVTKEFEEIEVM